MRKRLTLVQPCLLLLLLAGLGSVHADDASTTNVPTPSDTPTPTTEVPTPTPATPTPSPTDTPSDTPTPTDTPSPTPATPTPSLTPTPTFDVTLSPTISDTPSPSPSPSVTITPTGTPTGTPTPSPTYNATASPSPTPSPPVTPLPSATPTPAFFSIFPTGGPLAGTNLIRIDGISLPSMADGPAVSVGDFEDDSVTILSSNSTTMYILKAPQAGEVAFNPYSVLIFCSYCPTRGLRSNLVKYTLYPAGTISSVTPTQGPFAGGTIVTITGQNIFLASSDIVSATLASSPATIVSVTTTGGPPTYSNVLVLRSGVGSTPGDGAVVLSSYLFGNTSFASYHYNPSGSVTGVSPSSGPFTGGTLVTVAGSNLADSASDINSVVIGGLPALVNSTSGAPVTIVVVTTARAVAAGTYNVLVNSTLYGITNSSYTFTYNPAGSIFFIQPISGPQVGGNEVTIVGQNLAGPSDIVTVTLAGVHCDVVSKNSTMLIVVVQSGLNPVGTGDVVVNSLLYGTTSLPGGYTVNSLGSITDILPRSGPLVGGNLVTITGSNLANSTSDVLEAFLDTVPATMISARPDVVVVMAGNATGFQMQPGTPGTVYLRSFLFGLTTMGRGYTYNPTPSISSLTPSSGPLSGGNLLTISGANLCSPTGDTLNVTVGGLPAPPQTYSSSQIVVLVPAGAAAGVVDVTTSSLLFGTATLPAAYAYNSAGTITAVSPNNGPLVGGNLVTVFGTNLAASSADLYNATVGDLPVASVVSITASSVVLIAANAQSRGPGPGLVQVYSVLYGATSLPAGYTYNNAPVIAAISPNVGPLVGGNTATISGSYLATSQPDLLNVTIGSTIISSPSFLSPSSISITLPSFVSLSLPPGSYPVSVSSTSYGTASLQSAYTYTAPGTIASVWPATGPLVGTNSVTINGTNLAHSVSDATAVLANIPATVLQASETQVVISAGDATAFGSRIGSVTITSLWYGTVTAANSYTYNPAGVISGISPTQGSIKGGYPITVFGSNLCLSVSECAVTVGAVPATSITSATQSLVVAVMGDATAVGTGPVQLVVHSVAFGVTFAPVMYTIQPETWKERIGDAASAHKAVLQSGGVVVILFVIAVVLIISCYLIRRKKQQKVQMYTSMSGAGDDKPWSNRPDEDAEI